MLICYTYKNGGNGKMDFSKYYDYNDGLLISKKTHDVAGYNRPDYYVVVNLLGHNYLAHRVIWQMFNGEIPEGMVIDHIDGNPGNNRLSNLRLATISQNLYNKKEHIHSGLPRGVTFTKGKYQAQISINGKNKYLGRFTTADEAADAYNAIANELHKEFNIKNRDRS